MQSGTVRKDAGLLSVGYGGRRAADFVTLLIEHGVKLLVDVRLTPVTPIPGFSGRALANALGRVGIEYRHHAELGNPPENREPFHSGQQEEGEARFQAILATSGQEALTSLVKEASRRKVAVLCAERDELRCHRRVIIAAARRASPELPVTVLA